MRCSIKYSLSIPCAFRPALQMPRGEMQDWQKIKLYRHRIKREKNYKYNRDSESLYIFKYYMHTIYIIHDKHTHRVVYKYVYIIYIHYTLKSLQPWLKILISGKSNFLNWHTKKWNRKCEWTKNHLKYWCCNNQEHQAKKSIQVHPTKLLRNR